MIALMISVWTAAITQNPQNDGSLWLAEADWAQILRTTPAAFVRRRATAWALLRRALHQELGIKSQDMSLGHDSRGRLCAGRAGLGLSVSYTQDKVFVALSDKGMIGIDAERQVDFADLEPTLDYICAPTERAWLASLTPAQKREMFYLLWTLKEVGLKVLGQGFAYAPSAFAFNCPLVAPYHLQLDAPALDFASCVYEDVRLSLAHTHVQGRKIAIRVQHCDEQWLKNRL